MDVNILSPTWMNVRITFSSLYAGQMDGIFCVAFIHDSPFTMFYVCCFRFQEMFQLTHHGKRCTIYSIILRPKVSIDSLFFCATEIQAVCRDVSSLRAMFYLVTCCHLRCFFSIFFYLGALSMTLTSASIFKEFLKRLFHTC